MHRKTNSMHCDYRDVNSSKNRNYESFRLSNSIDPLF